MGTEAASHRSRTPALHACPIARRIAMPPISRSANEEGARRPPSGLSPYQGLKGLPDGRSFIVSRDAKFAGVESIGSVDQFTALIADINTGQVMHKLPLDMSALGMVSFSPDGRAIVRKVVSNG